MYFWYSNTWLCCVKDALMICVHELIIIATISAFVLFLGEFALTDYESGQVNRQEVAVKMSRISEKNTHCVLGGGSE